MKGKASDILNKVPQQNQITKDNFEDYPHPYEINEERQEVEDYLDYGEEEGDNEGDFYEEGNRNMVIKDGMYE